MGSGRSEILLLLAALVGLGLAIVGSVRPPEFGPAPDSVAEVNGHAVTADDYARRLEAHARDKRTELTVADRRAVLDQLIDEQLLMGRAAELGLFESDATVRKAAVTAMIEFITAEARGAEPTEDALRAFFDDNLGTFTTPDRYLVETLYVPGTALDAVQADVATGAGFAAIRRDHGADWPAAPPPALLTAATLAHYISPVAAAAIERLEVGAIAGPFPSGDGGFFIQLQQRDTAPTPAFDEVRTRVLVEWQRRRDEQVLKDYLAWLREQADVQIKIDLTE